MDLEVLSVISAQLQQLRRARLAELDKLTFEGRSIALKDHHVIVTMNPGYAGRTELPDNLKVLFRPCTMMAADVSLIAEVTLLSEGFDDAKVLSHKIVQVCLCIVYCRLYAPSIITGCQYCSCTRFVRSSCLGSVTTTGA